VTFTATSYNALPHPNDISENLLPENIVTGKPRLNFNHMKICASMSEQPMTPSPELWLNPTGSRSSSYYFMSLASGMRIHRKN
jgi:hypothetical protein